MENTEARVLKAIESMPNYEFMFKGNTLIIYEVMGEVTRLTVHEHDRMKIYNLIVKH